MKFFFFFFFFFSFFFSFFFISSSLSPLLFAPPFSFFFTSVPYMYSFTFLLPSFFLPLSYLLCYSFRQSPVQ